jgi:hypothetical protein
MSDACDSSRRASDAGADAANDTGAGDFAANDAIDAAAGVMDIDNLV